jgi:phosphomannomutase
VAERREHLLKIGVSGVRGVIGEFLTPAVATAFAQAFGTYVGSGRVVLGRDTRASGPMLTHAVTCGLLAAGCEVVHVGVLPTPTIQLFVASSRARGGLALTASHNPPEYNALKLFNSEGLFFNNYERGELVDLYHQRAFREATNAEIRGTVTESSAPMRLHIGRVLAHVDADLIRSRRFRVALDAVNGAGSVMTPGFLRHDLGCELHAISIDPTKPFPRIAEPRPDTLGELAALVRSTGAHVGFAHDPDGDRLAVCDETGHVIDNDDVLALAVDAILRKTPGPVVINLTTSSVIDDVAKAHGCQVHRTAVGEANVVEGMRSFGAVIGGEGSNGGIIFPGVHLCRDSYTGMALLLERMAETGAPFSALVAALPRYSRRLTAVRFEHGRLGLMIQGLEQEFPDARTDRTDGLKLHVAEGWVHVRASNTEPLLRIAIEARDVKGVDALEARVNTALA